MIMTRDLAGRLAPAAAGATRRASAVRDALYTIASPEVPMPHPCRTLLAVLVATSSLALAAGAVRAGEEDARTLQFTYETTVGPVPAGAGTVDVFVPMALDDAHQTVLNVALDTSIPGEIGLEEPNGNRYWHGRLEAADGSSIHVRLAYTIRRTVFQRARLQKAPRRRLSVEEMEHLSRYLMPDARVPVGRDVAVLQPILTSVEGAAGSRDPARLARSIYDWVVDNMEYKKTGTGWGNGDVYWACSERYGNCTDFHSLYMSLARTEGIPSRFEMGFPVPQDRSEGEIGGYHCWLQFWLPGVGWYPIDASEASKDPDRRELFYGTHPADRILFTRGRDLTLGPQHRSGPLNYFIYPLVEVDGKRWDGPVARTFTYRDVSGGATAEAQRLGQ
jgi:transglutaminase-like putative cysteine protease